MSNGVSLSLIRQIALPVDSVDKAKTFYRDVLGMQHLFDAPPALSFFDCGGIRLMLAGPEAQGKDGDRQHAVLFYDVTDIKTTITCWTKPRCIPSTCEMNSAAIAS